MTGILWGLLGAIFIGVSDAIGRVTTQRVSLIVLILFIMGLSTLMISLWLALTWNWPSWDLYSWSVSILSGLLNVVALLCLFSALARGPVSVASSSASSFAVILVLFNMIAGQPFNYYQISAIIIVFLGIIILTQSPSNFSQNKTYSVKWLRITALLGLGTGFTVAIRFFLAQESVIIMSPIHALYLNRFSAFIFILVIFFLQYKNWRHCKSPSGSTLSLVCLQSILETLALGAFLLGSLDSGRVGVAIGFSIFAPITTLTAWIWLGETVSLNQIMWIGVIAIAISMSIIFQP